MNRLFIGSLAAILLISALAPLTMIPASSGIASTDYEAIHFPTVQTFVGFSDPVIDRPFLLMLKEAGVSTVTILTDPVIFQAYKPRYESVIAQARELGFKIHLINQMDWKYRLNLLGLKNPLQTIIPPAYSKILWYETEWMKLYASYQPDYLSVLAEPSNLNLKMRKGLGETQFNSLIQSLVNTVKSISPNTETWIDLIADPKIADYYLGFSSTGISNLDGIGYDVYGNSTFPALAELMPHAVANNKRTGFTETWWRDIYAHSEYDDPINAPYEAVWFSQLYNQSIVWGVTPNLFDPFFSNKFVLLDAMPTELSLPVIQDYADRLKLAIESGNRTIIFYGYQSQVAYV